MIRSIITLLAAFCAFNFAAWTQSTEKPPANGAAVVRGTVKDASGAVIPNAAVTITDQEGRKTTTKTSEGGTYTFRGLAPGIYSVTVDFGGMQQSNAVLVNAAAGQAAVGNVTMTVRSQKQEVTVTDSSGYQVTTEAANNASALVLKQQDLDALPDDPDDLEADLEALAGPSAGPGGNQIFVDGFTGGRMPPKSSIREIRINSNPFSAEYDKLGYGRIEIFTKPGTDKFHGQGYYGLSDGVFNSRNPFLTTSPPFKTQHYGGNVSGPLGAKASFFIDVDRRDIDDNGIINATIPAASFLTSEAFKSYYSTPQRRTTVSPRVDYQLSPNNTLSFRYSYLENDQLVTGIDAFNLPTTNIGDITFPSTGYSQSATEHLVQLVDTAVLSPRILNETHFQYARDWEGQASESTAPQLNVGNSFISGGSGYSSSQYGSSYDLQNQYELQNYTSVTSGAHVMKFGLRIRGDVLDDYSVKNFNGAYTFQGNSQLSSIDQYLTTMQLLKEGYTSQQVTAMGYGPSLFTMSAGKPFIGFSQLDFGPFMQDDWRVKPNLTLSMGLRWEAQTNISDKNDWAPRVGIAWAPGAGGGNSKAKTVIRAGWGTFYDRFQALNVLNAYRFNGENQVNYVVYNPTSYNESFSTVPPASELVAENTEQRYEIDSHLRAPRVMQTVVAVERQLFSHTRLSVNFMNSRGVHELRTDDINAPLPGTYTGPGTGIRPYGDIGDIYLYESSGIFKQTQLITSLNTMIAGRVTLFGRYVYGQAHSDTDGLTTMPADPYDFSSEYGRSSLDMRHMVFIGGSLLGPWGIRLSPFFVAHSGIPFNITTGTDLYGTGSPTPTARPSIVSGPGPNVYLTPYGYLDVDPEAGQTLIERNAGNGPGFIELNLR
ncbi:MAG: carboxypeptidase regulatory-like domain-containing protein, partial [Bryobacteraceae bacterium]